MEWARRGLSWKQNALDLVAQLGQRCRGRRARQAGADDDHLELPLVRRVDQLHVEAVLVPLLRERPGRDFGVEVHVISPPPFLRPAAGGAVIFAT